MSEVSEKCKNHASGEHCWHEYGNPGFRGKYETFQPVMCCHCKVRATRHSMRTNYEREYHSSPSEAAPMTTHEQQT